MTISRAIQAINGTITADLFLRLVIAACVIQRCRRCPPPLLVRPESFPLSPRRFLLFFHLQGGLSFAKEKSSGRGDNKLKENRSVSFTEFVDRVPLHLLCKLVIGKYRVAALNLFRGQWTLLHVASFEWFNSLCHCVSSSSCSSRV